MVMICNILTILNGATLLVMLGSGTQPHMVQVICIYLIWIMERKWT